MRRTAIAILRHNSRLVDFDRISDQFTRLPDARARIMLLPLMEEAPKWTAAVLLLRAVGDADPDVQRRASRLLDVWMDGFNRVQSEPQPQQLKQIQEMVDRHEPALSPDTVRMLRFIFRTT